MVEIICRDGKRIGIAESREDGVGVLVWFGHNVFAYSMDHAIRHEGYSVESLDTLDCNDVTPLLENMAERMGLTAEFEFIPFSQSRHAKPAKGEKPWQSLNWRVLFRVHGGARIVLETEYAQGTAWAPADKRFKSNRHEKARAIAYEIESGRECSGGIGDTSGAYGGKRIKPPSIGDVLHSLAQDADILNAGGFEEWASNFGYDSDSRAAEAIYKTCMENTMKLLAAVGQYKLAELQLAASFN